jgi:hypothetical protein
MAPRRDTLALRSVPMARRASELSLRAAAGRLLRSLVGGSLLVTALYAVPSLLSPVTTAGAQPAPAHVAAAGGAAAIGAGQIGRVAFAATASAPAVNSALAFGDAWPGITLAQLAAPIVGIAAVPGGRGYWLAGADGGVFSVGGAEYHGSLAGRALPAPIVGIAATPGGAGYWLVGADGSVYPFGNAGSYGEANHLPLVEPIVGISATADGRGYWLAGADGGVFGYGDAHFHGSATSLPPSDPVVGIAATHEGNGYWLVDATGEVLAYGSAALRGSAGALHLNAPIVGLAATADDLGYWLVGADGGVFSFGDARFEGSSGASPGAPVIGIAAAHGGRGYWIAAGAPPTFINTIADYAASRADNITVGVYDIATGQTYAFRPDLVEYTASTVKVDILATLLNQTQAHGPLSPYLQSLAVPMIEDSLDSAADALWGQLGPPAIGAFDRAAGLTSTFPPAVAWWAATPTTVEDRLTLLKSVVFPNSLLTPASRAYMLYLMENVTQFQDWGATGGVPAGVTVALKNGFAFVDDWQMNTTGWVDGDGRDYLIAVLTNGNYDESYGIATVDAISSIIWNAL